MKMSSGPEPRKSMEEDLSLMLMTFLTCWIIVTNVVVIIVLLRNKDLRHRSHVIFLINIMCCFLVQSICGSPYVTIAWLANSTEIGCHLVRIMMTFVSLLLTFAVFLLMIDLCVQLKSHPFHEMGAGRSAIMIAFTWILTICMTVLLHIALPHIAPPPEVLPDCILKHSFQYDIIHYSVSFIMPQSMLILTVFAACILRCKQGYSRRLHYHTQIREVVDLITRAKNRVVPSGICTVLHLAVNITVGVLHMYYIIASPTDNILLALRVSHYVSYAGAAVLPLLWILMNNELRKNCIFTSDIMTT